MKHIPGPWYVLPLTGKYYGTKVQLGDSEEVLTVWTPDHFLDPFASPREIAKGWKADEEGHDHVEDGQSYATACLIAAAPELLRVAELLVDWLDEEPGAHKLCDTALAAIAKATGKGV